MNDVYALVRSLRSASWPRNRHFEAHATELGQEARRLHRFLRGLERDVAAADRIVVRAHADRFVVKLEFDTLKLERVVTLTPQEHAILSEIPALTERLQPVAQ
ncbi:MAG TPA: hypothetical protein VIA18_23120 [Polyangia bacterium]|nr:hypothetical protein [Polyangia bacterium]